MEDEPQTLAAMLQSREDRAQRQRALLDRYGAGVRSLVSFTLNIPGPIKDTKRYRSVFDRGTEALLRCLAAAEVPVLHRELLQKPTGPEGFFLVGATAEVVKRITVEIEDGATWGRLCDMDVLGPDGVPISRSAVGKSPRRCYLCGEEAKVCARSQRHPLEALLAKVEELCQ